jgi:hypothetical protein
LFHCTSHSKFLVLAQIITGIIVFEEKNDSYTMFLQHTVTPHINQAQNGSTVNIFWTLQKPMPGVPMAEGCNVYGQLIRALDHPSQGVRHHTEGCRALGW